MRLLALLVVSLVATAALAGCTDSPADDADEPVAPQGSGSSSAPPGGTQSGSSSAPATNSAPRITLSASAASGSAPFNVTFSLAGDDPDGDTITWDFDADGDGGSDFDGEGFPSTFEFTYAASGSFVARLDATDGTHPVSDTVNITITPGVTDDIPDPITITGTATGMWVYVDYVGDPTVHTFPLDVVVNNFTAVITWPQQTVDLDWRILTPSGDVAGLQNEINVPADAVLYDNTESPIVVSSPQHLSQLGEWTIEVIGAVAVESPYTITITFA